MNEIKIFLLTIIICFIWVLASSVTIAHILKIFNANSLWSIALGAINGAISFTLIRIYLEKNFGE